MPGSSQAEVEVDGGVDGVSGAGEASAEDGGVHASASGDDQDDVFGASEGGEVSVAFGDPSLGGPASHDLVGGDGSPGEFVADVLAGESGRGQDSGVDGVEDDDHGTVADLRVVGAGDGHRSGDDAEDAFVGFRVVVVGLHHDGVGRVGADEGDG